MAGLAFLLCKDRKAAWHKCDGVLQAVVLYALCSDTLEEMQEHSSMSGAVLRGRWAENCRGRHTRFTCLETLGRLVCPDTDYVCP